VPTDRPKTRYPEISWWGWGDPSEVPTLPDDLRVLLTRALGASKPIARPGSIEAIAIPPSRLDSDLAARLAAVVGPANALDDRASRVRHLRGKSTPDLLRMRAGDGAGAPDLVVCPGSHDDVLELLRICSAARVAVVPFGGGTTVVGGLEPESGPFAGMVALDVRRMNALLSVDVESRLAVVQPGLRGPEAEDLLAVRGFTIGHFPQSFEYATLGGYAATRSSGQASAGYGRFDDMVLALQVATPAGTIAVGRAPKSAAGPDLRQLFLGSEGTLGVITELTVQVRPLAERRLYEGWRFGSFERGVAALRRLAQDGPHPTVLRLSDEAETALNLARTIEPGERQDPGGCLAIVGYEGRDGDVEARRAGAHAVLTDAGAEPEPDAGERWAQDRYRGPYLRDALLDDGAIVETLETATFWSSLEGLYRSVSRALRAVLTDQGSPPVILCHVSHVYPSGASLYFTVACAARHDPVTQWRTAKAAASDAILAAGGSITHHHGVGRDHLGGFAREAGELGTSVLRAIKRELDPAGILNPGILIPQEAG
jgi:alkyldihydroxyacetonephosphate synthase